MFQILTYDEDGFVALMQAAKTRLSPEPPQELPAVKRYIATYQVLLSEVSGFGTKTALSLPLPDFCGANTEALWLDAGCMTVIQQQGARSALEVRLDW
jgi:hypothetical protein